MEKNHKNCKDGRLLVPLKVETAFKTLTEALGKVTDRQDVLYCTGGFIRDVLLDAAFSDIDLAIEDQYFDEFVQVVKALPAVSGYGSDYSPVEGEGKELEAQIELVRFVLNSCDFDLKRTVFGENMSRDVLRRDFTINSLYLNLCTLQLVDPADFLSDVFGRVLRGVDRYSIIFVDRNRIIRSFRFKYRGFSFHPELAEYLRTGAKEYLRKATDIVDLQRLGGELRKCFSSPHYREILSDLIEGELLRFICHDQEVLRKSLDVICLMNEITKSDKWLEFLGKYQGDRAEEAVLLVVYSLVFYFQRLYEAGIIKKTPFSQFTKCMLRKSRAKELVSATKKIVKIADEPDFETQQKLLNSLIVDVRKNRPCPTEVFLLSMLMKTQDFFKLNI